MLSRTCTAALVALIVVAGTSSALADDDDVQHNYSITISPVHLALPVAELTAEFRVTDQTGVAALIGAGKATTTDSLGNEDTFDVYEAGASFRYYMLGSFIHGMQLGAEVLYAYVSGSEGTVSGTGEGLVAGPFVGYKVATNVGFTFDAQLGVQVGLIQAEAEDSSDGDSAEDEDSALIPLLNINIGWSF